MNLKKLKRKLERRLKQIPINDFVELYSVTLDELNKKTDFINMPTDIYLQAMKITKDKDVYYHHLGVVSNNLIYFREDDEIVDSIKDIKLRILLRSAK